MGEEGGKTIFQDDIRASCSAPAQERAIKRQKVSSSSTSEGYKYDVFLSFRGPDTRNGFIDFLNTFLHERGINTFKDDEKLEKGEPIGESLVEAIRQSRIFIPVFSQNYASSIPCLEELAAMVKWKKTEQEIVPIFYDVTPSNVKKQDGSYKAAFEDYVKTQPEKIDEWRSALKQVAELSGWEKDKIADGKEGELTKIVVEKVGIKLNIRAKGMPKHLVEMEQHIGEIEKLLDAGDGDNKVRKVGIHGMCGIGKTTISKTLYNKLLKNYERHSFLEDIDKKKKTDVNAGIVGLQKQLIKDMLKRSCDQITSPDDGAEAIKSSLSGKRVLLVLDGVEDPDYFRAFAHECFGPGSTIIVTTRNKGILDMDSIPSYKLTEMNFEQSRELLSKHAFDSNEPPEEFRELFEKVVSIIRGLPLSLTTIGRSLHSMPKGTWIATHKILEAIPYLGIRKDLEVCYKEFNNRQKEIFLDIACFLTDVDQRIANHMWESCGLHPDYELRELNLVSLVEINDNMVKMHRLLREFGQQTVRGEHRDLARRSRLWSHVDAFDTLKNRNQKKCKVLALCLAFPPSTSNERPFEVGLFRKLQSLRFLQLDCAELEGNFEEHLCELRWLCWRVCRPEFAPTKFPPEGLVILDLSKSNITDDWAGWSDVKMAKGLKVLNLTGCCNLTVTPNFSGFSVLARLILQDCKRLVRIDSSITCLDGTLEYLNLMNCEELKTLPRGLFSMKDLEILPRSRNCNRGIPDTESLRGADPIKF